MHIGKYVFAQIVSFLPQRQFRRIVLKYPDKTQKWSFSHWNHLLTLMFGQLLGCGTLRELTDITAAHGKRSYHLGFGETPANRNMLRVKRFWGESENAVRIQIHVAIITYCLVAIIEHDLKLDRPVFEVMRILGSSLLVKDNLREHFDHRQEEDVDDGQLELDFLN